MIGCKNLLVCSIFYGVSIGTVSAGAMGSMSDEVKWSAIYAGLNTGASFGNIRARANSSGLYTFNNNTNANIGADALVMQYGQFSVTPASGVLGLQLGYNWQHEKLLLGLETSYDFQFEQYNKENDSLSSNFTTDLTMESYSFYSIRSRIGYLLSHILMYGTGGLVLTNEYIEQDFGVVSGPTVYSQFSIGWTVGGGVEWMFIPNKWTLNIQYLFLDYGTINQTTTVVPAGAGLPVGIVNTNTSVTNNVVTVGINYLFG